MESVSDMSGGSAVEAARRCGWEDPPPKRATLKELHGIFKRIPKELLHDYRYFRGDGDFPYMSSLAMYLGCGMKTMGDLKFDNSLAALRLWNFMMYERERQFKARQRGRKIFATIQDFGALAPIIMAGRNTLIYDFSWPVWDPFFTKNLELFNLADRYGLDENYCAIRVMVPAMMKQAYAPTPDICFAPVGAVCDDGAVTYQMADWLGRTCTWFEIPVRKEPRPYYRKARFRKSFGAGTEYQEHALDFLAQEFLTVKEKVEEITGSPITPDDLRVAFAKVNRCRDLVSGIRDLVYGAPLCPLPATEMMFIEFAGANLYGDPDECILVLEHVYETVKRRVERGEGVLGQEAIRVTWAFLPLDVRIFRIFEDMGVRAAGADYMFHNCRHRIDEEGDPLRALADNYLSASSIGSCEYRADLVIEQARRYGAEGVVFPGIFGASHCPAGGRVITDKVKRDLGLPTLSFDITLPGDEPLGQIRTRSEAFVEMLKSRRRY
ncbi:MAG: 2-hydroxyacyl-CoA dehydratase [Syntrophaceae bacterium]|nr:2-hydroxyacyl-CoA dehydratase [Syntrophaceae bacterium]